MSAAILAEPEDEVTDRTDLNDVGTDLPVVDDEDDNDPALVPVALVYDLALRKTTSTSATGVTEGGTVVWTVSVFNQGEAASGSFTVTDTIPAGMSIVSGGGTNGFDPCTAAGRVITCVYTGASLTSGQSAVLNLTTRADDLSQAPFRNWAEISADAGDDIDSTPDTTTGDDDTPGTGHVAERHGHR